MTDLTAALDETVNRISELTDEQLQTMLLNLERAHIHAMVEAGLRSTRVS